MLTGGEGRIPEQIEMLAVEWEERGDVERGRQRRRGQVESWLRLRRRGLVGMWSCCCFSGHKSDGGRGEAGSAAEVRMMFMVLKGCANKLSLVTGSG